MLPKVLKKLEKCKNDRERWVWVFANKKDEFTICLDNDETTINVDDSKPCIACDEPCNEFGMNYCEDDTLSFSFDNHIGRDSGLVDLFEVLEIPFMIY